MGTMNGNGDDLSFPYVRSARDNLKLFCSYINLADNEMICIGMFFYFQNLASYNIFYLFSPVFHLFYGNTGDGQRIGKGLHILIHVYIDIILHPKK